MDDDPQLRDIFAAAALMGLLASKVHSTAFHPTDDADYCYKVADAMMLRRAEGAHQ